jgi:hypothetical protein
MSHKYEEYNKMLNRLYAMHTDLNRIYIKIKSESPLTDIERKAVKHFISKLRIQDWVIDVDEYVDHTDETHVTWEETIYYMIIQGKLIPAKL